LNTDVAKLKVQLVERMQEVADFLLPNGQLIDMQWTCGSVKGEPGQSLKLELYGAKAGLWKDFAEDEGGDVIKLWQLARDVDFKTTLMEIDQFLQDRNNLKLKPKVNAEVKAKPVAPVNGTGSQVVACWHYYDPKSGELLGKVHRKVTDKGKKTYTPHFRKNGDIFQPGFPKKPEYLRPLYFPNADQAVFNKTKILVVTEGEKAADTVRAAGFLAVTSPNGSMQAKLADWQLLTNIKRVVIWADNDAPGSRYADEAAACIKKVSLDCNIQVLTTGTDKSGDDAVDWFQVKYPDWGGYTFDDRMESHHQELLDLFDAAPLHQPAAKAKTKPTKRSNKHRVREGSLILESFDQVDAEKVTWVWEGKIAEGKINLISGEPDTGKTNLGMDIIARITRGDCWPLSTDVANPGHVLVLSSEDGSADTLIPRLMAYDADLSKVHRIRGLTEGTSKSKEDSQKIDKVTTSALIKSLRESLNKQDSVRMIFIDPLSAYLDVRNAHSEAEVRSAMEPLADFAEEYEIAILAIAHVNKSGTDNAMDKISGSKGIVAQARSCYMAIKASPELGEQDNYFAKVKVNISSPEASQGLTYRIESAVIQNSVGESIEISKVQWTGTCPDKAGQILKKRSKDMGHKQLVSAELWLVEFLEDSPRKAADVRKAGKAAGHSDRTLDRARNELGFTSQRIGFGGNNVWFNKKQFEQFQGLLDQNIPADEALFRLDSKCEIETIDGEATQLNDNHAATNDQEQTNE